MLAVIQQFITKKGNINSPFLMPNYLQAITI